MDMVRVSVNVSVRVRVTERLTVRERKREKEKERGIEEERGETGAEGWKKKGWEGEKKLQGAREGVSASVYVCTWLRDRVSAASVTFR